jgi:hypothetical protein
VPANKVPIGTVEEPTPNPEYMTKMQKAAYVILWGLAAALDAGESFFVITTQPPQYMNSQNCT